MINYANMSDVHNSKLLDIWDLLVTETLYTVEA